MSTSSSPPTDPERPYIHIDHILEPALWLRLTKFKYFLHSLPDAMIDWKDFPVTHDNQANMNSIYNLIEIQRAQELVSLDTKNLLNSILLGLIHQDVDRALMAKPPHDPKSYSSPPPSPFSHMTPKPQPPTTDSLPSPPPITPTSSSTIIQSDDNLIWYRPYCVQGPKLVVIDLSTDEDSPKEIIVQENIRWRKKVSKNVHHCKLCWEQGHTTNNCWTFKCRFCNEKASRHWSRDCTKRASGSNPLRVITAYDNTVEQIRHLSLEL